MDAGELAISTQSHDSRVGHSWLERNSRHLDVDVSRAVPGKRGIRVSGNETNGLFIVPTVGNASGGGGAKLAFLYVRDGHPRLVEFGDDERGTFHSSVSGAVNWHGVVKALPDVNEARVEQAIAEFSKTPSAK